MIRDRNFVIMGIQPWDIPIGSNCKNIAIEIAKNNKVLYVNMPLDRNTRLNKDSDAIEYRKKVIEGEVPDLVRHNERFWVLTPNRMVESINKIKFNVLYNLLNYRNNKIFAGCIARAIKQIGFDDFYLFNDNHIFLGYYMSQFLHPRLSIYYMRDFLSLNKYWKYHGSRLEPRLIKKSDLVLTNSLYYEEYAKAYNLHSYMVGQGCDLSLFHPDNNMPVPEDMLFHKPVIGYVGYLTGGRLDIPLLVYIAETKPEWNIILVGPEDVRFKESPLHNMPNVHFLGAKPEKDLPKYINAFDIAINPQQINAFTVGNYPRKVDEYLAMGKPTVVTKTKAMEYFGDQVYACKTKEDYIEQIGKALLENNFQQQEQRKQLAAQHTWEHNVAEIYKYIEQIEKE